MNTHDSESAHKTWILFLSFSIFLMFHILTIFDTNDSVQINKRPRPSSRCYWFQQMSDRYTVKIKCVNFLHIENPDESDSGDYFCVASNAHSTNQKSVAVQIQYAPQVEVNSEIVVYICLLGAMNMQCPHGRG